MVSDSSNGVHRSVFAALIGLILCASSPPKTETAQDNQSKKQENYSTQLSRIAMALERYESSTKDEGCENAPENRRSDLCAQWKAADAAKNSFWVSLLGSLLGLGTLFFAWRASIWAKRAAQSANNANTIVEETQKPRLIVTLGNFSRSPIRVKFDVLVTNIGGSGCAVSGTSFQLDNNVSVLGVAKIHAIPSGETVIVRNTERVQKTGVPNNYVTVIIHLDGPFLSAEEKTITKRFNIFADVTHPMRVDYADLSDEQAN